MSVRSMLVFTGLWYAFSTMLSLYNKMLMSRQYLAFPYPLLTSATHAGLQWCLSTAGLWWMWWRRRQQQHQTHRHHRSPPASSMALAFMEKDKTVLLQYPNMHPRHSPLSSTSMPQSPLPIPVSTPPSGTSPPNMRTTLTTALCGVAGGLDIGLSNASLIFITLSFYTMCKSTVSFWVALLAIWLGIERASCAHLAFMSVIVGGAMLTVAGETKFHPTGFMLVMLATVMSAVRWALTQVLLSAAAAAASAGGSPPGSPIDASPARPANSSSLERVLRTLKSTTPYMFGTLLFCSWLMEFGGTHDLMLNHPANHDHSAHDNFFRVHAAMDDAIISTGQVPLSDTNTSAGPTMMTTRQRYEVMYISSFVMQAAAMSFGGLLAFLMTLSEYALIQTTSVVTFSLAGLMKEGVILTASVIIYGDEFDTTNFLGLVMTMAGILFYQVWRNTVGRRLPSPTSTSDYQKLVASPH